MNFIIQCFYNLWSVLCIAELYRRITVILHYLVGVVVADDALVLGEAELAALIGGQSKSGQEAGPQSLDRREVIGNCRYTRDNAMWQQTDTSFKWCLRNEQTICLMGGHEIRQERM